MTKQTKEQAHAKRRERESTPEWKANRNKKLATPEWKEKRRLERITPKAKATTKTRNQRPDVKARNKQYHSDHYLIVKDVQYEQAKKREEDRKIICWNHYTNNDIKCKCCGEKHTEFFSLDHIYNNGAHHRKQVSGSMYKWIIDNNFPPIFQLLCMNCNWSRRFGQTCPHQIKSNNGIWNAIISMFTGGWRL